MNTPLKSQRKQKEIRSKSPVSKFTYELPKSFFEAVDDAREESGYDPLPRLHHLSTSSSSPTHETSSPSSHSHHHSKHHDRHSRHHHHKTRHEVSRSSSASNKDKVPKEKVRVHRRHSHHHRKDAARIPSPVSLIRLMINNAAHLLSKTTITS